LLPQQHLFIIPLSILFFLPKLKYGNTFPHNVLSFLNRILLPLYIKFYFHKYLFHYNWFHLHKCAKHRYSTYFIHFQELMSQLKKALTENRLEIRLKYFSKYKVLIIDKIWYLPIGTDASNISFQLI
jgi:hypothetical protein